MGKNLADDLIFDERGLFTEEAVGEEGPDLDLDGIEELLGAQGSCAGLLRDDEEGVDAVQSEGDGLLLLQSKEVKLRDASLDAALARIGSIGKGAAVRRDDASTGTSQSSGTTVKSRKLAKAKRRITKPRDHVTYFLDTKYDVLSEVIQELPGEWQEANVADDDVNLLWFDSGISVEKFIKLRTYQKVNHFVGMTSITRKNNLGRNLLRMKKRFPEEYRFFPDTWILPTDLPDFKAQFNGKKNKTFIVKPSDGYQGRGIFLTREFESVPVDYNSTIVVQRYIHKPLLLDGHKFDLRLYVLVTGCDPMRIFLHEQGLVRLASEKYAEPRRNNLQQSMVHLTNYAINCENPDFQENTNPEDGTDGHKRSYQAVLQELGETGVDVETLRSEIEDLVVKTLISVQPSLSHVYRSCQPDDTENAMCFEILGFDILLDAKAKPWLIEVNQAPSFRTETQLDHQVKHQVLRDAFAIVNINPEDRKRYSRQQAAAVEDRMRSKGTEKRSVEERLSLEEEIAKSRTEQEHAVKNGYKPLYPVPEGKEDEHEPFMSAAVDIWEIMTGSSSSKRKRQPAKEDAAGSAAATGEDRRGGRPRAAASKAQAKKGAGPSAMTSAHSRASSAGGSNHGEGEDHHTKPEHTSGHAGADDSTPALADGLEAAPADACSERHAHTASNDENQSSRAGSSRGSVVHPPGQSAPHGGTAQDVRGPMMSAASGRQVGESVHVQTNFGWEPVTILRIHDTGQLDIKFQDGEVMLRALPRILDVTPTGGGGNSCSSSGGCTGSTAIPPTCRPGSTDKKAALDTRRGGSPGRGARRPNTGLRQASPLAVVSAVRSTPARAATFSGQAHAVIPSRRPLHPPLRPHFSASPDGASSMPLNQMCRAASMPTSASATALIPAPPPEQPAGPQQSLEVSIAKRADLAQLCERARGAPPQLELSGAGGDQNPCGTSSCSLPSAERRSPVANSPGPSGHSDYDVLKVVQAADAKRRQRLRPPPGPPAPLPTKDRSPGTLGRDMANVRQPHFTLEAHSVQPPPSWQRRRDAPVAEPIPPLPPPGSCTQRQRPLLKAV